MPQAAKPAMTSGPGAMSQRTDGGPASKQAQRYISGMPNYGDGQDLMNLQASAPMAQTGVQAQKMTPSQIAAAAAQGQQGQAQGQQQQQAAPQPVTPLFAPTQRPNEPVTAGSPMGAGPGPDILGLNPSAPQGGATAKQTVQTLATRPDASPELKNLAALLGK